MTEDAVSLRYETRVCAALHAPHTRTALVTQCGKPTYPAVGSGPTPAISVVAKMIEPMGCHPDPNTNKQTDHTQAQTSPMWALSGLHSRAHMPARAMTPSSLATSCRNTEMLNRLANTPAGPFGLSRRTHRNIHKYSSAEVGTTAGSFACTLSPYLHILASMDLISLPTIYALLHNYTLSDGHQPCSHSSFSTTCPQQTTSGCKSETTCSLTQHLLEAHIQHTALHHKYVCSKQLKKMKTSAKHTTSINK